VIATSALPVLSLDMSTAELETYITMRVHQRLAEKWKEIIDEEDRIMINGTGGPAPRGLLVKGCA
jgi:hypothetical protein